MWDASKTFGLLLNYSMKKAHFVHDDSHYNTVYDTVTGVVRVAVDTYSPRISDFLEGLTGCSVYLNIVFEHNGKLRSFRMYTRI